VGSRSGPPNDSSLFHPPGRRRSQDFSGAPETIQFGELEVDHGHHIVRRRAVGKARRRLAIERQRFLGENREPHPQGLLDGHLVHVGRQGERYCVEVCAEKRVE